MWTDPKTGEIYNSRPRLDSHGHEVPDPTPVAVPSGFRRPETLAETVARLVRREVSDAAEAQGFESFEEADDFEVDDDPQDPGTPYETFFDPILGQEVTPADFKSREAHYRELYVKRSQEAWQASDQADRLDRLSRGARSAPHDAGEEPRAAAAAANPAEKPQTGT